MEGICDKFPAVMPFIPTSQVMQKLIAKAATLKSDFDVLNTINPKERKRLTNEHDLDEDIFEPYQELRVRPVTIKYPDIENNWPGFFTEVNLEHLAEKYKPDHLKDLEWN